MFFREAAEKSGSECGPNESGCEGAAYEGFALP